jgi:hypothetical protein|tara:strand:+ start:2086 stop:2658 length:573 start_codon:yes stop_codon:yes gene_type:complete
MPWKYNGVTLKEGREFTGTDGTQYPKVWMRYSADAKKTIGITWEDPPASELPFDKRFYSGRQVDGTLIPKSLTDVNVVDDDGNAVNSPVTGKQMVELGLKSVWVAKTKATANNKLAVHDWYVVRNAEKSTAIPSSVSTYRDAVRTKCGEIEAALNGASDLAAFMALFEDTRDSDNNVTAVAKINDWPDEI